jgi:hypothetical protein
LEAMLCGYVPFDDLAVWGPPEMDELCFKLEEMSEGEFRRTMSRALKPQVGDAAIAPIIPKSFR